MRREAGPERGSGDLFGYLKTHIWVEIFASVALVSICLLIVFGLYLRDQYYRRMVENMRNADNVAISAAVNSLNNIIENQLYIGSEIGLDDRLLDLTDTIVQSKERAGSEERRLRNVLSMMTHYSEDIAAVTVINADGVICEYGRYWDANGTPKLWSGDNLAIAGEMFCQVRELLDRHQSGYYCVSSEPAWREDPPRMNLYHIAFPLIGAKTDLGQVDSVVIISYHIQAIARTSMPAGMSDSENTFRYLADTEDNLVYHEDEAYIGWNEAAYLSEQKLTTISQPLDYFGWRVAIAMDEERLRRETLRLFLKSCSSYAVVILAAIAGWALLLRRILKPLSAVREAMEAAERGTPRKIEIRGEHEIWALASEYNEMMDALEEQREIVRQEYMEKIRLEALRNRAERIALESQINAHFIFNTLNAINYNVMEAGNIESARLIRQLSNILRYTLSQNVEVTLGREFDIAVQYLSLQKYRLMDKFEYEVDFPEEYSEWPCCKLFLQPFIENSISHGFAKIDTGGKIRIAGSEDQGYFRIEITDNGCGMDAPTRDRIRGCFDTVHPLEAGEGKGIGIKNVVARMRMFFGDSLKMALETAPGEGTCFTFWLPIPGMDAEDEEEDE